MAFSDRELIARLVQCEAGGEGETGNRAGGENGPLDLSGGTCGEDCGAELENCIKQL